MAADFQLGLGVLTGYLTPYQDMCLFIVRLIAAHGFSSFIKDNCANFMYIHCMRFTKFVKNSYNRELSVNGLSELNITATGIKSGMPVCSKARETYSLLKMSLLLL